MDEESEQEFVDFGGWRNQMGECEMSRNGFPDCEREYNSREEAVEMAREERSRSMSDTPNNDEVICPKCVHQFRAIPVNVQAELAEVKQENLKLSALVVERDYQITLANKGYDYEGAVEDARHYKEKYLQVCAQHGRLVDQVYEEDGETLKHIAAYKKLAAIKGSAT